MTGITPDLNGQNGKVVSTLVRGLTTVDYVGAGDEASIDIYFPDGEFSVAPTVVTDGSVETPLSTSVTDVTADGAVLHVSNPGEFPKLSVRVGWIAAL